MNYLNAKSEFDYSVVDPETENMLIKKYYELDDINQRYSNEVGKLFKEVQDKLSKKGYGCFGKWIDSTGFSRSKVYSYIQHYSFVQSLDNQEAEIFEELPVSLKNEISKSNSNEELRKQVFSGDIKNSKEYKSLEAEIELKNKKITSLSETVKELDKQPRVIEKEVQVTPIDYETKKIENEQLIEQNKKLDKQLRDLLSERSKVDEKSDKYEQLSRAIQSAEGQLSEKQKLISDYKRLSDLISQSNEFLAKAGGLVYQDLSEVINRDNLARRELDALENRLERFLDSLRSVRKEKEIIEGDVIDE